MSRLAIVFAVSLLLILRIEGVGQESTVRFAAVDPLGNPVTSLKVEDIRVTSKSTSISPTKLSFVADAPLSLLILIDASASQERVLPFEKQIAEAVIDGILRSPGDRVGIAKFTGEIQLVHDLSTDLQAAKASLKQIEFQPGSGFLGGGVVAARGATVPAINRDQLIAGATSIFDSVAKAIAALKPVDAKDSRKVVLLISDGVNTYGDKKIKEVIESSTSAGIPVFAVGVGDTFYDGVDEKTLKKLSEPTGGIVVLPTEKKADELKRAVTALGHALRNFYVLAFLSGPQATKEISVEIINPALKKKVRVFSPRFVP